MGMLLSAFMNNIAALVITMPVALAIARDAKLPPGAVLMPLSFATILGGMTTLIGTPANIILSTVREDELGAPFGMFDMTPVGGAVAGAGLLYLVLIGWRLAPRRGAGPSARGDRVLVFELGLPMGAIKGRTTPASVRRDLRAAGAVLLGVLRDGARARLAPDAILHHDDRVLAMSRADPAAVAKDARLIAEQAGDEDPDAATAHVSVVHGSSLIGQDYGAIAARTGG